MFGPDPRSAAIALPIRPLHEMYAEPARAFVERHGGAVRTGVPATLHLEAGGVEAVSAGPDRWQSPVVVSSVPWFALRELLRGETSALEPVLKRADTMVSSPIITVNLWFDRPLFEEAFIGLPGRAMQWVFDKRAVFGGNAAHLSLVSSGASPLVGRTNGDLIAAAHQELLEALPSARAAQLSRATVVREPRATFSLAPGQPARPEAVTPVKGLLLAGDWIATGLPATIESAVQSGHRAADLAS
jgi:hypothetical protein